MLVKVRLHGKVYVWLVKVGRYIMVNVFNGGAPVYLYIGALFVSVSSKFFQYMVQGAPRRGQRIWFANFTVGSQAFKACPEGATNMVCQFYRRWSSVQGTPRRGNEHIAQGIALGLMKR